MSDTDNNIRTMLAEANGGADYDLDREEGFRDMLVSTFRGKLRWATIIVWVYMFLFTALAVFSAVRFFLAEAGDVRMLVFYAGLFLSAIMIIMVLKMWYWMLMNRNALLREVKRLELRVADLSRRVAGDGG